MFNLFDLIEIRKKKRTFLINIEKKNIESSLLLRRKKRRIKRKRKRTLRISFVSTFVGTIRRTTREVKESLSLLLNCLSKESLLEVRKKKKTKSKRGKEKIGNFRIFEGTCRSFKVSR